MARKTKTKKWQKTGLETNADILERIGGSGGSAKRYSQKKRPDIMKLRKKSKPLTTKTEAARMIRTNKAEIAAAKGKKKKVATDKKLRKTRVKKAATYGAAGGVGYAASEYGSQWINQGPEKKKKK